MARKSRLTCDRRAKRAQTALAALWLGVTSRTTKADRLRLVHVEDGLHALDDEQAALREGINELLREYVQEGSAEDLIDGLRKLVERKD